MAAAKNVIAKTWHCQNLACWKYHRVAPLEYSKNMDTSMSYQVIWKCRKWLQFKVPKNGKRQIMALVVCSLFGAAFSSAVASAAVLAMEDGPCPMDGLAWSLGLLHRLATHGLLVLVGGRLLGDHCLGLLAHLGGGLLGHGTGSHGLAWAGCPLVDTCWDGVLPWCLAVLAAWKPIQLPQPNPALLAPLAHNGH